jgi:hypothetical protein
VEKVEVILIHKIREPETFIRYPDAWKKVIEFTIKVLAKPE